MPAPRPNSTLGYVVPLGGHHHEEDRIHSYFIYSHFTQIPIHALRAKILVLGALARELNCYLDSTWAEIVCWVPISTPSVAYTLQLHHS